MKLTAKPFDMQTGELLPVYEEAYLRGDLSRASAKAVEDYLRRDARKAHGVVAHWHQLHTTEQLAAPTWIGTQLRYIRQQPQRVRNRVLGLGAFGIMLMGSVIAHPHFSTQPVAAKPLPAALATTTLASSEASLASTVVLHGRILNEKGQPLPGATVLQKGTAYGTTTDANGNYLLRVPAHSMATLQYGYGGYTEQELPASQATQLDSVVLQPKARAHRHWLSMGWLFHK